MATIGQQVAEQVTRISTEVNSQIDLIAQVREALEGKSVPEGTPTVDTHTVTISWIYFNSSDVWYGVIPTLSSSGSIEYIDVKDVPYTKESYYDEAYSRQMYRCEREIEKIPSGTLITLMADNLVSIDPSIKSESTGYGVVGWILVNDDVFIFSTP